MEGRQEEGGASEWDSRTELHHLPSSHPPRCVASLLMAGCSNTPSLPLQFEPVGVNIPMVLCAEQHVS